MINFLTNKKTRLGNHNIEEIIRNLSIIPCAIGVVENNNIIGANNILCKLTGYCLSELINFSFETLFTSHESYIIALNREHIIYNYEIGADTVESIWKRKNGSSRDVALSFNFLNESNNNKTFIFLAIDITRRNHFEDLANDNFTKLISTSEIILNINQRLEEKNTVLTQLNQALNLAIDKAKSDELKAKFLGSISHEIRTPLNGIIGFSSLLKGVDNNAETLCEYIGYINQCGHQLIHVIEQLVEASKLESGQEKFNTSKCDLNVLLKDVYKHFSKVIFQSDKNITLSLSNITEYKCDVFTDSAKLTEILSCLLQNAIQYTDAGRIEFGVQSFSNDKIIFFVSDSGCGIPKEMHDFVFRYFTQIED